MKNNKQTWKRFLIAEAAAAILVLGVNMPDASAKAIRNVLLHRY